MEVKRSFMGSTFFWVASISSAAALGASDNSSINTSENVFGITSSGLVYHKDGGQRGNFAYLCLDNNCQAAQLKNGQWQAQFSPSSSSHHIEFKVDSAQGQCISKVNSIEIGEGVNSSVCIYNESLALRRKGEFGIDKNGIVYHLNDDLTARFVYLCVDGDCQPAYKSGNYWERSSGQRSGSYDLQLKIQDDVIGQCIHSANDVAVGESRSDTPCANPLPNNLPSVEAGSDVSVEENNSVVLTGLASDDDGDIISYTWSQVGGPIANLPSTNADVLEFIAPEVPETSDLTFELSVSDDEGGVSTDRVVVTVIHVNKSPVISAGEDIVVQELTPVTLLGQATDADGDTLSYEWQQISGPTASIANNTSKNLTFTAPEVAENILLEFELTVSDGQGAVVSDRVTVSVVHVNKLPTVSAGEDQTVQELLPVTLTAIASDLDGDALSFEWQQLSGPTAVLANNNSPTLAFVAPEVPQSTTMVFEVTVSDGLGGVARDQISVNVVHVNKIPTVSAGADQTVEELSSVTLVGQASDGDGDALSFEWVQISGPSVTLTNPTASSIQFKTPEVGSDSTLVFELRVSDGHGGVVSDQVTINVLHINKSPSLSIGAAVDVDEGATVTLTSEASDPDGDALTFTWRQLSGPAVDFDPSAQTLEFIAPEVPENRTLRFELIVSDGNGGTASGEVSFSVNHVNKIPTVSVGDNQVIEELSPVSLMSQSSDPDGDTLSYQWQQISGTPAELIMMNEPTLSFEAPEVIENDILRFQLTVSDGFGGEVSDHVDITVLNINKLPSVSAGANFETPERETVRLAGKADDQDGTIVKYQWAQISGPSVSLLSANVAEATFTAPNVNADTTLSFRLTVTDNEGAEASDTVVVTVLQVNSPPTVNAGENQTVDEKSLVEISAVGNDPDGDSLTYQWRQVSGQLVSLSATDEKKLTFTAPSISEDETLIFEVVVTDPFGETAKDSVTITVIDQPLLISSLSTRFGLPGTQVRVELTSNVSAEAKVIFSGLTITPSFIEDNTLIFEVPTGAETGPLYVKDDDERTNSILFTVSDDGLAEPDEDDTITDDTGTQYVSSYLIVVVNDSSNNFANAQRIAGLVSGSVIGSYKAFNWWQISVDASSIEELEALADLLETDASVDIAVMDVISNPEAIAWNNDPQFGQQRDRNRVEEGAELYTQQVSLSDTTKVTPFSMAIGVAEVGIDFSLPDFSLYNGNVRNPATNISLFSQNKNALSKLGDHGSNVTGIIAGQLGDQGNAGLVSALGVIHSGANIEVNTGRTITSSLIASDGMMNSGAQVINWGWGVHRQVGRDVNNDGVVDRSEVTDGALQCNGNFTLSNAIRNRAFSRYKRIVETFFAYMQTDHPSVVIVSSAGNGATNAGDIDNRLPTSVVSDQLMVVGAHTSGGSQDGIVSEDRYSAINNDKYPDGTPLPTCFDTNLPTDNVKRAYYSNYGSRIDISASGSIKGWQNAVEADIAGTSYAAPIVTSTIALMQSINPNLSPQEIRKILHETALPIENTVLLGSGTMDVFTRPLSSGQGARLNVEGALQGAIATLEDSTLPQAPPVPVDIDDNVDEVTKTIEIIIPDGGSVFNKVDIVFVVDVSGSYRDDLSTFRSQASQLLTAFSSGGADVHIGLTSYSDFPQLPYGRPQDYSFRLDQALTSDPSEVQTALNSLTILSGGDFPESQLEALYQTAQPAMGWRDGALPVIFLATDASFHDSDRDSEYPGVGYSDTLATLLDLKATVFGLQSGGTISDVMKVTNDTGGEAFNLSRNSAEIVEAVLSAIDNTNRDLSVSLKPSGDFANSIKSIRPSSKPDADDGAPIDNVNPGDTVSFDVTFTKGSFDDGASHTLVFRLLVQADDVAVIQEIPVILNIN